MPQLTVATYNTYREQEGRDQALDALLRKDRTLICLQEVSLVHALEIKRTFGSRAFVYLNATTRDLRRPSAGDGPPSGGTRECHPRQRA